MAGLRAIVLTGQDDGVWQAQATESRITKVLSLQTAFFPPPTEGEGQGEGECGSESPDSAQKDHPSPRPSPSRGEGVTPQRVGHYKYETE